MTDKNRADLGAFQVAATQGEVAAFRSATRCLGEGVPLTFPMRWLASPELRRALLAMVPEPDLIPVHESQTFEYVQPLTVDQAYVLTLSAGRESAPDRLVVAGVVASGTGEMVVRLETILRLFPGQAAVA